MSTLQSFACPTCAAPITITGDVAEVRCEYCGNMIVVPPELRAKKLEPPPPAPQIYIAPDPVLAYALQNRSQARGCTTFWNIFVIIFVLVAVVIGIGIYVVEQSSLEARARSASAVSVPQANPTQVVVHEIATNTPAPTVPPPPPSPAVVSFGGKGTTDGLFSFPRAIAVDNVGNKGVVYVGDTTTGRIQRFDHNGQYANGWQLDASAGKSGPDCLATDSSGNVYACQGKAIYKYAGDSATLIQKISGGSDNGDADKFQALAIRADGTMVAYSSSQDELLFISAAGKISKRIKRATSTHDDTTDPFPSDSNAQLAVDGQGGIYLLDTAKDFVLIFGPDGQYRTRLGGDSEKTGILLGPLSGIAVDGHNNVFVSSFHGIEVFDTSGHYLTRLVLPGFIGVGPLAVNDNNELYTIGTDSRVYRLNVVLGR